MPGPAGFADTLSEAQAVLLIEDLFGGAIRRRIYG
jgi:hypothetical protein